MLYRNMSLGFQNVIYGGTWIPRMCSRSLQGCCWVLEKVGIVGLNSPLGDWKTSSTSFVLDISETVPVFDPFEDSASCKRGLIVSSLKDPPNGCYEFDLNIQRDSLSSFLKSY